MKMDLGPQAEICNKDQAQMIIKGKRTKRQRPLPSLTLAMASSSSSGSQSYGGRISDNSCVMATPTSSNGLTISTEEEEDMANCLMLLAQGNIRKSSHDEPVAVAATTSKVGPDIYQCKTCDKCFPSFQALGGHRTSHKKAKATMEENHTKGISNFMVQDDHQEDVFNTGTALSLRIATRAVPISVVKNKVHECSICGAEFSSGQALGGHMRRHRSYTGGSSVSTSTISNVSENQEAKKTRNMLQLDLNLPAPEDDNKGFSFASKEQVLVFSASSLVDCHY